MKRKQAKRSEIFLLELIIVILFFCVTAAICVRLFVKSHIISQDAKNLNMAVNQVTEVAEVFRLGADMQEFVSRQFQGYEKGTEDFLYYIYYNENWEPDEKEEAVFCLTVEIQEEGQESYGQFSMKNMNTDQEIYAVSLEKFNGEAAQ